MNGWEKFKFALSALTIAVALVVIVMAIAGCDWAKGSGQDPCAPNRCEVPASPASR
jgi:hypothetical protein